MIGYALLSTTLTPFRLTCRLSIMVITLASWSRGGVFKSQQRWEIFLIFKNHLCKLPIGIKFQLGKNSNTFSFRKATIFFRKTILPSSGVLVVVVKWSVKLSVKHNSTLEYEIEIFQYRFILIYYYFEILIYYYFYYSRKASSDTNLNFSFLFSKTDLYYIYSNPGPFQEIN